MSLLRQGRKDPSAYIANECRNCGSPETDHLVVGTALQCLFAPGSVFSDLPPERWLQQAEDMGMASDHLEYWVSEPAKITGRRDVSTWEPGPDMEGEI